MLIVSEFTECISVMQQSLVTGKLTNRGLSAADKPR